MKGESVGSLRVYVVDDINSRFGQPLWQVSGEQKHNWIEGIVPIPQKRIRGLSKFHVSVFKVRMNYYFMVN